MTRARKIQVSLSDTPYYNLISRCVRRAFLCGKVGKKSFEHRRGWLVDRIEFLSSTFTIDVCSYAIMSNHYHLVIKVDSTKEWNDKQVLSAWASLYQLPKLCDQFMKNEFMGKAELVILHELVGEYRKRLMDLSWFMKCLNEYIAHMANKEDGCTGCFWEGRFKSQALLDERALLTCMVYVDLNPIRAAMAATPEDSDYTSIQSRIKNKDSWLLGFGNEEIPYYLTDYVALVDYTGRAQLDNKRGSIPNDIPDVFHRLNLDPNSWLDELKKFKSKGRTSVGTVAQLKTFCKRMKAKWVVSNTLTPALE
jgi:REP element-mobilizing transposase RayT